MSIIRVQETSVEMVLGSDLSPSWPSTTTRGNLLLAFIDVQGTPSVSGSIVPPAGWTLAVSLSDSLVSGLAVAIYYIENAAPRSGSETFHCSTFNPNGGWAALAEYSGIATFGALDKTATGAFGNPNVTSVVMDSGTTSTTIANSELWVALFNASLANPTSLTNLTAGFTLVDSDLAYQTPQGFPNDAAAYVEQIVATTGTAHCNLTVNTNTSETIDTLGLIATFIGATSGTAPGDSSAFGQSGSIGTASGGSTASGIVGNSGSASGDSSANGQSGSIGTASGDSSAIAIPTVGIGTAAGDSFAQGQSGSIGIVPGNSTTHGQSGSLGIAIGNSSANGQSGSIGTAPGDSFAQAQIGDIGIALGDSFAHGQSESVGTATGNAPGDSFAFGHQGIVGIARGNSGATEAVLRSKLARIQAISGVADTNFGLVTSVTTGWLMPTTPGNLLVAFLAIGNDGLGNIPTPTLPLGWTLAVSSISLNDLSVGIYYIENSGGRWGNETVTFSFGAQGAFLALAEYSGIIITGALDQIASNHGIGASLDSGTALPSTSQIELWVAFFGSLASGNLGNATNGFKVIEQSTYGSQAGYSENIVINYGTANTGVTGNSGHWAGAIAAFAGIFASDGTALGEAFAAGQAGSIGTAIGDSFANAVGFVPTPPGTGSSHGNSFANAQTASVGLADGDSFANAYTESVGTAQGDSFANGKGISFASSVGTATGNSNATTAGSAIWKIDLDVRYKQIATFDVSVDFSYNLGSLPLFWFRVEGLCITPIGCANGSPLDESGMQPIINQQGRPISGGCPQKIIQVVAATTPADVCNKLAAIGWVWPIARMSKFSIPVLPADEQKMVDAGTLDPNCNQLTDVPINNIPCKKFSLVSSSSSKLGSDATVIDTFFSYTGSGTIHLSGSAPAGLGGGGFAFDYETHDAKGSGGLKFGGSAKVSVTRAAHWHEVDSSAPIGILLGGTAQVKSSHCSYVGGGEVQFGGEAEVKSSHVQAKGGGFKKFGGSAAVSVKIRYKPTGLSTKKPRFAALKFSGHTKAKAQFRMKINLSVSK